jgi:hypothetical protein
MVRELIRGLPNKVPIIPPAVAKLGAIAPAIIGSSDAKKNASGCPVSGLIVNVPPFASAICWSAATSPGVM